MKKIIALALMGVIVISATACGNTASGELQAETASDQQEEEEETVIEEVAEEPLDVNIEEPDTLNIGEQVEVDTEYGDFLLTVDNVRYCDWIDRSGGESDKYVAVLVECDIDNISFDDPYNADFWLDQFFVSQGDDGYVVDTLGNSYDDGLYSALLEIPAGSKGRIVIAYKCGIDVQSLTININGQYILEAQIAGEDINNTEEVDTPLEDDEEVSEAESYYNLTMTLTKEDLTKDSLGLYEYNGITFLEDDCAWIDSPLNTKGSIHAGSFYRELQACLEYFSMGNSWTSYAKHIIGFTPENREEFEPYVEEFLTYMTDSWFGKSMVSKFQTMESVDVVQDGEYYTCTIYDVNTCAEELKISAEMLGYILGALHDSDATITFDGNICVIEYFDYSSRLNTTETPELSKEDFIANGDGLDNDNIYDLLEEEYGGEEAYQYFYYNDIVDENKEGVITTYRGIQIGSSLEELIDAYGEGRVSEALSGGMYEEFEDYGETTLAKMLEAQSEQYIVYDYEDKGQILFYIDSDDTVSWVFYLTGIWF